MAIHDLIPIHNQGEDLLADSRDVAQVFGITHQHLRESIEDHETELTSLGVFRVETGKPLAGSTGGRPEKYYWLNFDQIAFLLTISRATEQTKEFRLRLIIAFRNARERLRPVDKILLAVPAAWKKTFENDFYIALLRLYGDTFKESENKPSWVGSWTNRFVYEPIYNGLPAELKARRQLYCKTSGKDADYLRLFQFLEEVAKSALAAHMTKITTLLTISRSKQDFIEHFATMFHGHQQLHLFLDQLGEEYGD